MDISIESIESIERDIMTTLRQRLSQLTKTRQQLSQQQQVQQSKYRPYVYNASKGKYEPHEVYLRSSPYIITLDDVSGDNNILVPLNSTNNGAMSNDQSGILDIRRLTSVADSDEYLVLIKDTRRRQELMNQAIHKKCIFGQSGRDFELPWPLYIYYSNTLTFWFQDKSGSNNDVRLAFFGSKHWRHDPDPWSQLKEAIPDIEVAFPYFYTTDSPVSLGVGVQDTTYITTVGHADFFLQKILSHSTGPYLFKIYDPYGFRAWSSGWVHSSLLGNAEYNFRHDEQVLLRTTQLNIELKNLHTAQNEIYLTLAGINYNV